MSGSPANIKRITEPRFIILEFFWGVPQPACLTWSFALLTRMRSVALFCALLRSFAHFCILAFAYLRLRSFARICALLRAFACFCVRPHLERLRLGISDIVGNPHSVITDQTCFLDSICHDNACELWITESLGLPYRLYHIILGIIFGNLSAPKSQRSLRFAIAMPIADPRNRVISETRDSIDALRFKGAMESR